MIEAKNVSFSFKNSNSEKIILDDSSLKIEVGEIVGLEGRNGVGKTTLIKLLCGLLVPTHGEITINGRNPNRNRCKVLKDLGVLFVKPSQIKGSSGSFVMESLELNRYLFGTDKALFKKKLDYYTTIFELDDVMDKKIQELSFGQKRKIEIMDILLHNPKILLLDEPTIGLDVTAKEQIRNCFLQLNATEDMTILVTSHDESDLRTLCKRTVKLVDGKIIEGRKVM